MTMYNLVSSFLIIVFSIFSFCYVYNQMTKSKVKILKISNLIVIILVSILYFIFGLSKTIDIFKIYINFTLILLCCIYIFKENISKTMWKIIIIYMLELILEIIFSIIFLLLFVDDIYQIDNNALIVKNLYSTIIILNLLLFASISSTRRLLYKISNFIIKKKSKYIPYIIYVIMSFIIYLLISFRFNYNKFTYITNIIFIFVTIISFLIIVKEQEKLIQSEEKQKIILKYMKKYEQLIDQYSFNKHEILNNLILLNSFKNKNNINFQETLNKLISEYSKSNKYNLKNISELPSGIKGFLYYKINDIKNYNLDFCFNCSKNVNKYLKLDNLNDYNNICKLLGIFMDNAIESANKSINKKIFLDIYLENDNLVFYIENSLCETVDLKKIKLKNYSTKGANRGLGLHIAKIIYKKSNYINYIQKIENNNFITILKLKIK